MSYDHIGQILIASSLSRSRSIVLPEGVACFDLIDKRARCPFVRDLPPAVLPAKFPPDGERPLSIFDPSRQFSTLSAHARTSQIETGHRLSLPRHLDGVSIFASSLSAISRRKVRALKRKASHTSASVNGLEWDGVIGLPALPPARALRLLRSYFRTTIPLLSRFPHGRLLRLSPLPLPRLPRQKCDLTRHQRHIDARLSRLGLIGRKRRAALDVNLSTLFEKSHAVHAGFIEGDHTPKVSCLLSPVSTVDCNAHQTKCVTIIPSLFCWVCSQSANQYHLVSHFLFPSQCLSLPSQQTPYDVCACWPCGRVSTY